MDLTVAVDVAAAPAHVYALLEDLETYPQWLSIVPAVDRDVSSGSAGVDGGDVAAWNVELRGRLGPVARSKRLRMVRTRHDAPRAVAFERREQDGRDHSPWRLEADVEQTATGVHVLVHLHYGGSLGGPLLERMLRDEVEASRPRFVALAETGSPRAGDDADSRPSEAS